MVDFYVMMINNKDIKFELKNVPPMWYKKVAAALNQ